MHSINEMNERILNDMINGEMFQSLGEGESGLWYIQSISFDHVFMMNDINRKKTKLVPMDKLYSLFVPVVD
jgi:hypothetical protein